MGRSRSRTPKKHHKSKHRKKSKSKERRSSSHTKHRDKSRERSSRLVFLSLSSRITIITISKILSPFHFRKRSLSITSSSSDDMSSIQLPKHRKKHRSRKMDEVERLAEMERQRRQKEAEQKVHL